MKTRAGIDRALLMGFGAVVGIVGIGAFRFALLPEPADTAGPHYHANFAVFLDGERLDLSAMYYMEDVATCKASPDVVLPRERAHMHEGIHDVVHVHHQAATWGHFFANLGFALGDDFLITDERARYFADDDRSMKFVLDGQQVASVFNRVIESGERLVISFGAESVADVLERQFPDVPSTAEIFNQYHQDAGGCSMQGPVEETTGQKVRRAFWF